MNHRYPGEQSTHVYVVLEGAHKARRKKTDRRHHAILQATGENFTVRSSTVFSSFSLSPVLAGVSLH